MTTRRKRMARPGPRNFETLEQRSLLTTLIALVDSGVDLTSAADSPYYDFTYAYDAYNEVTVAQAGIQAVQDTSLQHGHGSTVADSIVQGIKDAQSSPGGALADVKIMPIRDTSVGQSIDTNALVRGVYWAADHGAAVINLSVNAPYDPVLHDSSDPYNNKSLSQAIQYAETKGAVVVTAAGNSHTNLDLYQIVYPPYSDDPSFSTASPLPTNLLVAAGVDSSGNLTSASNWGAVHVDLGAPAVPEGATSYSAGYTTGVAAVVADLMPPGSTPRQIISVITQTVTPHAQSVGPWSRSGGVINPAAAVAKIPQVAVNGLSIDAGGQAAGSYVADTASTGGRINSTTAAIATNGVINPAPQQVYQTERYGDFSYTLTRLTPGTLYEVRLDFAEFYWSTAGRRIFNVSINGEPALTKFDIFAEAGGMNRAIVRQFLATADSTGRIQVQFTSVVDNAKVSGISIAPAQDLARGKQVFASSIEGTNFGPGLATDGDSSTRWSSGQWMQRSGTGWLSIDLGRTYRLEEVRLNWERAYASDYQVQISDDNLNWTTIDQVKRNTAAGWVDLTGLSGAGRYVRIYCSRTSGVSNNFSLYDLQVYGLPVLDLAEGKAVVVSSLESGDYAAAAAVDGKGSTRWSSGQWKQDSDIGWISVDLGAGYNISEVRLDWERAFAVDYQVQVSDDNVHWTTIETVQGNTSAGWADLGGLIGSGRYVRIYCTKTSSGSDNYSLYDFMVIGSPLYDLALGRPSQSSSIEGPAFAPGQAVDGSSSTRWSSGQWTQTTDVGWLSVDLGNTYEISEVKLDWERAYAVEYEVQVSDDNVHWTTIETVLGNTSAGWVDLTGLAGVGQYVRIYCSRTSEGADNYSLRDFQVYGVLATSPAILQGLSQIQSQGVRPAATTSPPNELTRLAVPATSTLALTADTPVSASFPQGTTISAVGPSSWSTANRFARFAVGYSASPAIQRPITPMTRPRRPYPLLARVREGRTSRLLDRGKTVSNKPENSYGFPV